jgi:hypothetical protein
MENNKTPLQLVADIQNYSFRLFEIRAISKALNAISSTADYETLKTITKLFANELDNLAGCNSDIYWTANKLQKALTEQVLADTADVDEAEPITDGEEVTDDDLPFC